MAYHQQCLIAVRPLASLQKGGGIAAGVDGGGYFELVCQRLCRLLRPPCFAGEYAIVGRQAFAQPGGGILCLSDAFASQLALQIGRAVFGLGVTPQNQIHAGLHAQVEGFSVSSFISVCCAERILPLRDVLRR